jgi:UDP-N-acetylmuramoylalanine--D-glutamate ligase
MRSPRFKNKKVVVLNLGLLSGGVATTNWLLEQGARVTVTDLADAKVLAPSVKRVEDHLKKIARDGKAYEKLRARLTWALGEHSEKLVDACSTLVVNPSVSVRHPYVVRALRFGKAVTNEGTLFYDLWKKKLIGVTGTRGKTTTSHWAHHLIKGSLLTGNSMTRPFQTVMDARAPVAVTELSSFILELFPYIKRGPEVAVITNLYRDHLNRHGTMEEYARAKAAIFAHQRTDDVLVLNADDPWTGWFLDQKPKAKLYLFSLQPLPAGREGVWYGDGAIYERRSGNDRRVAAIADFEKQWGMHNVANLLAAASAARHVGVSWNSIQERIATVPVVPYRQEVVHRSSRLTVVNDTTATSPEGGTAALRRWGGPNCILITGGTDLPASKQTEKLDYRAWAAELPRHITKNNTIFLAGSATQNMRKALGHAARGIRTYDTLEYAWRAALKRAGLFINSVVLFSPAAKSFELFANEFDRGAQFNALVTRDLKK